MHNKSYAPPGASRTPPPKSVFLVSHSILMLTQAQGPAEPGHLAPYFPASRSCFPLTHNIFRKNHPFSTLPQGSFQHPPHFLKIIFPVYAQLFLRYCKIISRYFVIYSCAFLQFRVFNVFHGFSHRFHCGKVENIVQRHKYFTFTFVTSWLHASFIYYRKLNFPLKEVIVWECTALIPQHTTRI